MQPSRRTASFAVVALFPFGIPVLFALRRLAFPLPAGKGGTSAGAGKAAGQERSDQAGQKHDARQNDNDTQKSVQNIHDLSLAGHMTAQPSGAAAVMPLPYSSPIWMPDVW